MFYRIYTKDLTHTKEPKRKRSDLMGFLRWLGGIVVLFWILGFLFKIGGGMIHTLLIIAAVVFIIDFISGSVG